MTTLRESESEKTNLLFELKQAKLEESTQSKTSIHKLEN